VRRRDLLWAGLAGACAPTGDDPAPPPIDPTEPVPNGRRPLNVLVVLTDDQRWDSFGFMGHPFLQTPSIDRLAREGAHFRQAFVTTSLCCPSRATMLTGRYAHDHGVLDNTSEIAPGWPTFATVAARAGVQTAYFGKWHMGGHTPEPRPGWGTWQAFRGQGRYEYPGGPKVAELDRGIDVDGVFTPLRGYITDLITDRAAAWLAQVPTDRPFCAVVAHKACHAPFTPAPRHRQAYADAPVPMPMAEEDPAAALLPTWLQRQRDSLFGVDQPYGQWPDFRSWYLDYHRTLLAVDEGVGRLLAALEARDLLATTAVLYLSDNGFMHGEKGSLDKRACYEPSVRVPWIARIPGAAPGQGRDDLVLNLDVPSTILDLLGLQPAPTMRGRSVLPVLLDEPRPAWRDAFLMEYFFEPSFPTVPGMVAVRTTTHKLIRYHGVPEPEELFDLVADPGERVNVAASSPGLRKSLERRMRQLMDAEGLLERPVWGDGQRDEALRARPNAAKGRLPEEQGRDHEDGRSHRGDEGAGEETQQE
jgi:N-acetylglucosamine-6-sulfatase